MHWFIGQLQLDGSNYGIVHHVILFECEDSTVPNPESEALRCGFDGYQTEMTCGRRMVTGSAATTPFTLPSEIYFALETGIYLMEVHFDLTLLNHLDLGDIDVSGSGLRTYYTSKQRETDLAWLQLILTDFAIPPNTDSYKISGALYSGCSEMYLPDEGIDILYILGHAHFLGRELQLDKVSRDGVLETLYQSKHYDFDRQLSRSFRKCSTSSNIFNIFVTNSQRFAVPVHYKLYPGDFLRIHCIFDSSDVLNWTYHGERSYDEMCIVFVAYTKNVGDIRMISVGAPGTNVLLNPSYCGRRVTDKAVPIWQDYVEFESLIFNNSMQIRSSNKGLKVEDDVDELCQLLLHKEMDFIPSDLVWRFDIPIFSMYPTVIIGIAMWFMLKLTEYALSRIQPGCYTEFADSVEHKRKVIVYLCSTLFYSVILVILLWEMCWNATDTLIGDQCDFVHNEYDDDHSVKIPYGITTAGSLSVIFLVIELMYRLKVCAHPVQRRCHCLPT